MPKVSVLIPIFNVEKYLEECLDSVVNQTLKDIEIVCIDDGSTDKSPAIIKKYAKNDKRIKVITKKNSGYGDSMNKGLEKATGEYIGIVESDDFIEPEMFEELYGLAKDNDTQVAKGNAYWYWTEGKKSVYRSLVDLDNTGRVVVPRKETKIFYQIPSIWAGIYQRDFITKNKIGFRPTPGASYQDTGFHYKVWAMADSAIFTHKAYLYYRQDNMSSSMNNVATKAPILFGEFTDIEEYLVKNSREEIVPLMKEREFVSLYNFLAYMSGQPARTFAKDIQARFRGVDIDDKLFETPNLRRIYWTLANYPSLYFIALKLRHVSGKVISIIK